MTLGTLAQGATYDTGMLIGLERRKQRCRAIHERLIERRVRITVPWVVLAEWWRGRTDERDEIARTVHVEEASQALAQLTGESLSSFRVPKAEADSCRSKYLADAAVMASAAQRGDVVYTSDFGDLARFASQFPAVRILGI